jgi:hypothetical protein
MSWGCVGRTPDAEDSRVGVRVPSWLRRLELPGPSKTGSQNWRQGAGSLHQRRAFPNLMLWGHVKERRCPPCTPVPLLCTVRMWIPAPPIRAFVLFLWGGGGEDRDGF